MPRPRKNRRILFDPDVTYFKPAGVPLRTLQEILLQSEELEALRLKDYQMLEQKEAAEKMNVSQPTFHRILLEARRKVSAALVDGKAIRLENRKK